MAGILAQEAAQRSRQEAVEALLRAFAERDLGAVRALAEAGCDLDTKSAGLTVLMRSVLRGDGETAEWILAAGADPGVRGSDGRTALDLARATGSAEMVELLVLSGSPIDEEITDAAIDPPPAAEPALPCRAAGERQILGDRFDDRFQDRFDDPFDDARMG